MIISDNVSENDKDLVYILLTNTSSSGTDFPSAIYLVNATMTNDISADLTTADWCNNYYSVLAHNDCSNSDTDSMHPDHTLPSVPSTG